MNNFIYHNPTKIVFGKGVTDSFAAELTKIAARKVLLVYGQNSIVRSGLYDRITTQLKEAGIDYCEHAGVKGNPVLAHARQGIELAKAAGVDTICAIGGGSVIDEGKAISLGVCSEYDIWDHYCKKQPVVRALRLVAVLTLPATGSEANGISVLTNYQTQEKVSLVCPGVLNPKISFLDPETTLSLSAKQTAYACTDIISHITESYFTTSQSRYIVQDRQMESIILGTMDAMDRIMADPGDYQARAAFMWCACMAWCGILQAGMIDWGMPCHALEMPMSGIYDVAHGAGLAIVIPAWIEVAGERHLDRLSLFCERIFDVKSTNTREIAQILRNYYTSIGSPVSFKQAGIESADIELLTESAYSSFLQRAVKGYDKNLIKKIYSVCANTDS